MKLILPIFHQLPIEAGFRIRNIGLLRGLEKAPPVICKIWKNFEVLASKTIEFNKSMQLCTYLSDHFASEVLMTGGIATLEFGLDQVSPQDKKKIFDDLFEAELILKCKQSGAWSSVLYDLIADKKPNHRYSPILHSAHSASVSSTWTTYALLLNFRPDYLRAEKNSQVMQLEIKNPEGQLLHTKPLEINFNSTTLISFQDELEAFGGFKPGVQLNFKGGESQFAIFTLFFNRDNQAIGMEHSLPPPYYSSAIFDPEARKIFYANAFKEIRNSV